MNVKEYLNQIEILDSKLEITRKEISTLKGKATRTSVSTNERVQCSLTGDKVADNVVEYSDLERGLMASEKNYMRLRTSIINFIFKLNNALYIKVLYKKYAEFKTLGTVAKELGFSEQYVKETHQIAIDELERLGVPCENGEKAHKTYQQPTNNLPKTYQQPT